MQRAFIDSVRRRHRPRPDAGSPRRALYFEGHVFRPDSGELFRGDQPIALRNQASVVLGLLLCRYPQAVTLDELRRAVWGATNVEWAGGLHQIVKQLRRALRDDARHPRFIETLPRRGYRFVAKVSIARPGTPRNRLPSAGRAVALWLSGVLTLPAIFLAMCWLLAT